MSGNRDIEKAASTEAIQSICVGNEVLVVAQFASNKPFVFTREQMEFLIQLQRLKNVHAAATSVRQTEEWADKFLKSKKFRSYLSAKMEEFSVKQSMNVEWWYQFGKWAADGQKEFYEAKCEPCHFAWALNSYDAESHRKDDMTFDVSCPVCYKPTILELKKEPFKPTREQIEAWKEVGSRLLPKVERVHHQFSKEEFIFESTDGGDAA